MYNDIKLLRKYLANKNRLTHCISTAETMMRYAPLFSIDKNIAYFCGLYHDIGKELPDEKLVEHSENFIKRKIVPVEYFAFKLRFPSLLHGVASAEIIINELGIIDPDILSSLCAHTLGGTKLSKLAKYTFMIDFAEPKRKYSEARKVLKILAKEQAFDRAYFMTYVYQIEDLLRRSREICPESIDGYNEACGALVSTS